MGNNRYNFIDTVENTELETDDKSYKSFIQRDFIEKFIDGNESTIIIPNGLEYRLDKLAKVYLGDSTLGWLIMFVNNLENGIEDLYVGKELIIPAASTITSVFNN